MQTLRLYKATNLIHEFPVSTAINGAGEINGSGCTPRGKHIIRAKIGAGADEFAVFKGRRETGERFTHQLQAEFPHRDWILARILWLSGLEIGKNRLGTCDTMQRYIYIHGAPPDAPMGTPLSHGCIRMRTHDVIELFDQVNVGTEVEIIE
jgi:lipoprotein-anchoring transpeptidase ErfK/SrfK